MKKFGVIETVFTAMVAVVLLALVTALILLANKEEEPAQINVRCIGDHLLFESERTGDIQVIANKCKKSYPKSQAPVGVSK